MWSGIVDIKLLTYIFRKYYIVRYIYTEEYVVILPYSNVRVIDSKIVLR